MQRIPLSEYCVAQTKHVYDNLFVRCQMNGPFNLSSFLENGIQILRWRDKMTTESITMTSNLSEIYPDVGQQLCNKHSKQLSKLKCLFGDIYDEMEPQGYVLVNGIAKVVDLGSDLQLSFALENGITLLFSKTYLNEDLFINGNHIEEELLFNSKGRHEDGIHELIDEIKSLIKLIRKGAPPGKEFYGGIFYVYSNICQNFLGYRQCFMIALAISFLLVHEELQNYTKNTIKELILKCDSKASEKMLSNLLEGYQMNKLLAELYTGDIKEQNEASSDFNLSLHNPYSDKSIGTNQSIKANMQQHQLDIFEQKNSLKPPSESQKRRGSKNSAKTRESRQSIESLDLYNELYRQELKHINIDLKENHKLILCKMDLGKDQEEYYNSKMEAILKINQLLQEKKTHKSQIINNRGEFSVPPQLHSSLKEQQLHLIEYCEEVRNLVSSLVRKNIQFDDFINEKHELDIEYKIHDEPIIDLLEEVRRQTKYIQNFCVLEGNIALLSIDRQYYAQIVSLLRKMLNQYRFSTCKYLQTRHNMSTDQKYSQISQIMFTTMPSVGVAIYQPTEDAWL